MVLSSITTANRCYQIETANRAAGQCGKGDTARTRRGRASSVSSTLPGQCGQGDTARPRRGRASSVRSTGARAIHGLGCFALSLEMARVPLMAGNWKMNPTSVTEVRCGGPYPCLPGCVCVPPLQCFSGGPGISPFQDPQQVGCRPGGGVRLWMGWMLCGYRGCEQVSS